MRRMMRIVAALAALLSAPALAEGEGARPERIEMFKLGGLDVASHPGKALYEQRCATCHEGGSYKAPHRAYLQILSPGAILGAMNQGPMREMAHDLDATQRRAIAEYLTRRDLAHYKAPAGPRQCSGTARRFDPAKPAAAVSWGHDTRRFIPASVAGLAATDVTRLKLKWAFGFPDAIRARSQPAIALGALFVGSQDGTVYAFDLKSGCARWTHKVPAEVRTAIVVEPGNAKNPRLFFGDFLGRVYALDALSGRELWRRRLDDHPYATITGAPALRGDTLFVPVSSLEVANATSPTYACCTFRGSVAALDVATGAIRWQHYTVENPPTQSGANEVGTPRLGPSGAPVWGSPAVDGKRGQVYFGSGENYQTPADNNSDAVFAVDATTGQRRWQFQLTVGDAWNHGCMIQNRVGCPLEQGPDYDLSASPLLVPLADGRDVVVVGQKSGMVFAVDPQTGKPLWGRRVGRGSVMGGVHFGMSAEGTTLFVGIYDHPLMGDGLTTTAPSQSGLYALDAGSGRELWRVRVEDRCHGRAGCSTGISSATTAMPGVVFASYLDGWVRAFDTATGARLWETDTAQTFRTVNGTTATGGSMSGPGVSIGDGYLVTNSGYGFSDSMPGNALLVFSIDGK